jgi:pimeloyl-ACP methyl ester carboxylesterase
MPLHSRLASFVFGTFCMAHLYAQAPSPWKDRSSHTTRFVSAEKNVQLEVLDWGGRARPVILLAGGGYTAHVFDDFAPKLAATWHVYGITRRGFGASGYSATDTPAERLGDDVLAVIDALKIDKPVLVGHSIAGAEMSSVANNHPDHVAGLVYLDAAYSYAFDNGEGADVNEMQALQAPQPPPPGPTDLASFSALQRYFDRVDGFQFPEAELRQQRESAADGRVGKQRNFPGGAMFSSLMRAPKKYSDIPVPALVIFANPHGLGTWVDRNNDASVRAAADAYSAALGRLTERQEKAIKDAVPAAHVITLPNANHFVFLSNEADVLREMRSFLAGLN